MSPTDYKLLYNIRKITQIVKIKRPIISAESFEKACISACLSKEEEKMIDYIRYIGTFTQPSLTKSLKLSTKPPALSLLCKTCKKIGEEVPQHFEIVRKWSEDQNAYNVRWDGNLICSVAFNIDGEQLTPEAGTSTFHTFVVHKELFQGLD